MCVYTVLPTGGPWHSKEADIENVFKAPTPPNRCLPKDIKENHKQPTEEYDIDDHHRLQDRDDRHDQLYQVGAVALDLSGNVASATSTGGITGKRAGRVSVSGNRKKINKAGLTPLPHHEEINMLGIA